MGAVYTAVYTAQTLPSGVCGGSSAFNGGGGVHWGTRSSVQCAQGTLHHSSMHYTALHQAAMHPSKVRAAVSSGAAAPQLRAVKGHNEGPWERGSRFSGSWWREYWGLLGVVGEG